MDMHDPCSKCLNPVGPDAVLLKNGCYMCPACYQRAYPTKKNNEEPQRFFVSVEGVLAVIITVGVFVGGYFLYSNHVASEKAERALAEKNRIERELKDEVDRKAELERVEKLRVETKLAQEAREKKFIADRAASKLEERMRVEEQQKKFQEIRDKAAAEKLHNEEKDQAQRREAELKAQLEAKAEQDKLNSFLAAQRAKELIELTATIAEQDKIIARIDKEKPPHENNNKIYLNLFVTRKSTYETALATYGLKQRTLKRLEDRFIDDEWDVNFKNSMSKTGNTLVVQESEWPKIVATLNKNIKEGRDAFDKAEKEARIVGILNTEYNEAKIKRDESLKRMNDLKATDTGPVAAPTPGVPPTPVVPTAPNPTAPARKPGFHTLFLKDGSTVQATNIMKVDGKLTYKDEEGKPHTINADDEVKREKNY